MSNRSNWLQENTASLIALGYVIFSFIVYLMVLTKAITATENITFLIINSITNIAMIIVGYHFGSSAGSKAKQDAIQKMAENTTSSTDSTTTTNTKTSNEGNNSDSNNR